MIIILNGRVETIDDVKDLCDCIGLCTSQDNAKELENSIEVLLGAIMNMDFGDEMCLLQECDLKEIRK